MEPEQPNGPGFWDKLCGPQGEKYPEYVSPDLWFGEYVDKLEKGGRSTPDGSTSQDSSTAQQQPAKLPRWKRRTQEQIEANKAAQKRFREKKKAKLQEQASKVEQLSAHVEGLSQLNADVQSLEQQNLELESSLWAKEAELNQLKVELDQKTPQAAYDKKVKSRFIANLFTTPSTLDERIEKVAQRWLEEKSKLESLLQKLGLEPGNTALQIAASDESSLSKQSLAVMVQCMEIMYLGGPQLEALLRTFADKEEDLMRRNSMGKYTDLVRQLGLTQAQITATLALREDVLRRLERLYMDRQGLNMKVMALLMPGSGGSQQPAAELRATLEQLQQNLGQEQRLESEHHHGIFRRILTPLQGAWFIVKAYPEHCDTLAFMHGVFELQKASA